MATDLLRVVVVSREPVPVTTVIRFKFPGCLPVPVRSVDDIAPKLRPRAIVLLDLGDVTASLDAVRRLRENDIGHGIVLIGTSATGGLPGVSGLQPPFELTDLGAAIQQAREHSARASSSAEPTSTSPSPPTPPPRPTVGPTDHGQTPPPAGSRQAEEGAAGPGAPVPAASEPPRPPRPVRRGPSTEVPQVALEAVTSVDDSLFTMRSPTHPASTASHGGAAAEPMRSKVDRWRKRLSAPGTQEPPQPSEGQLHERLVQIFAATSQIESIAAELPIVTDLAALFRAIVMAVADEFTADSVVLWRRAHQGWVAAAHRGLTVREARLPVGFDQPVLRDVDVRSGAILLDPTASFQHLISGIGGARPESFMAAAIAVGSNRLGILAVGRDEPLVEDDLDRLVDMAVEAAVGIGVAEHIQRMSSLVAPMAGGGPRQDIEPGQWRDEVLDDLNEAWHARRQDAPADAAAAAGAWSALATSGDADTEGDEERGAAAAEDETETVIDLTSRKTKRA